MAAAHDRPDSPGAAEPTRLLRAPQPARHHPWEATLERQISFHKLRTSPIIFRAISTDLKRGRPAIFRNEELTVQHILASCSIPVVYPWTQIDQSLFWDGVVMANTPLSPAIDEGAGEIYVVLLSPGRAGMKCPRYLAAPA